MQVFEKTKIGKVTLKNRLVMAPMGVTHGPEGRTDERAITYYEERAKGGFGLIIPGGYLLSTEFEPPEVAVLNNREQVPLLGLLCDKVHFAGAKIAIQIASGTGRNCWIDGGTPPKSASDCDWFWQPDKKCIPFTIEEIKSLIAAHGTAARLAKDAGADMLVFTCYGGYLTDQFLTPLWNTRTDEYGGSFENRNRFMKEAYDAIRAAVGPDFPVIYKYTAEHRIPGGRTLEEGIELAKYMEELGADALIVDLGSYDKWYLPISTVYSPEGYHTYMAEAIKKAGVKIPLLISGNQRNPEVARKAIESGAVDFVMIGHQTKADPYFASKLKHGNVEDIRPCIGCNECLNIEITTARIPSCAVNPQCFFEKDYPIIPADQKKKVLVIGGGPAGIETALVARERGHDVQIWEKSDKLGGNLKGAGAPSFKVPVKRLVEYYNVQIKKAGITVYLNKVATIEDIKRSGFDHIVCAAGSSPIMPPIPGINGSNVINSETALCGEPVTGKAVVIGGGLVGCETALHIAQTADEVTLIELLDDILLTANHCKNNDLELRQLISDSAMEVINGAKVVKIEPDKVICEKDGKSISIASDKVIIAVGYKANSEFVKALENEYDYECLDIIGDAVSARKVHDAVHEGFHVACRI